MEDNATAANNRRTLIEQIFTDSHLFSFQPPEPEQAEGPRRRAPGPPPLPERHPVPADRAAQCRAHRPPPLKALHSALHFLPGEVTDTRSGSEDPIGGEDNT